MILVVLVKIVGEIAGEIKAHTYVKLCFIVCCLLFMNAGANKKSPPQAAGYWCACG
jgi:uncharacterized membrane protein YhaH (DUF805 family)